MLINIAEMRGSDEIYAYFEKYGMKGRDLSFIGHQRRSLVADKNDDPQAVDLALKMTVADHANRITAKEALEHPYFDKVRDYLAGKTNPYADK